MTFAGGIGVGGWCVHGVGHGGAHRNERGTEWLDRPPAVPADPSYELRSVDVSALAQVTIDCADLDRIYLQGPDDAITAAARPEVLTAEPRPAVPRSGYAIDLCSCPEGPHLGARKMGTPCCCERCGFMTVEQHAAILATAGRTAVGRYHEHDGSGCIECACNAAPWSRDSVCTCPPGVRRA